MKDEIGTLGAFLREHTRILVLTGAGISTSSGIGDYRDRRGEWKRVPPMTIDAFRAAESNRARYWARSLVGWPVVDQARPNGAHHALKSIADAFAFTGLVTQNVDGLHARVGHHGIELHGALRDVVCIECGARTTRSIWQSRLLALNPGADLVGSAAPDGDADIDAAAGEGFRVPACVHCGGIVKPDVVFFGESVPAARVAAAMAMLAAADALLVVGSSLMVFSGYRFCRAAHSAGKPIAAINLGRTRADAILSVKVEADCAAALEALATSTTTLQ